MVNLDRFYCTCFYRVVIYLEKKSAPFLAVSLELYQDAKCAVLQIGRSLVQSQQVSLEFFIDIKSFRSHYGPRVDAASNRNEYQEYFLGVKADGV